jgi:hypothetical protein
MNIESHTGNCNIASNAWGVETLNASKIIPMFIGCQTLVLSQIKYCTASKPGPAMTSTAPIDANTSPISRPLWNITSPTLDWCNINQLRENGRLAFLDDNTKNFNWMVPNRRMWQVRNNNQKYLHRKPHETHFSEMINLNSGRSAMASVRAVEFGWAR